MYAFRELLEIVEHEIKQISYPAQPKQLYDPIAYALEEGGKRVRPVMVLMACNMFRGGINEAKATALAVEIFHNFTLLHDDIMDRSELRRGKPAVRTRWNDNTAILSGDAMVIQAYQWLCRSDEAILPRLLERFNAVALGVCEGQQYDMDFESRDEVSVEEYLKMIRLKTAVLLAGALELGALCGGAQEWQAELLYRLGINIGMAFQLQDDLFDTYGDAAVFGKPIGGDILEGKKTYLLTQAMSLADAPTRERLVALLHDTQGAPEQKIDAVRAIYDQLGIRKLTEKAVADYFKETDLILHSLDLPAESVEPLRELANQLLKRKK